MNNILSAQSAPLPALLLALSLAGCFGGEDGGTGTPVNPEDTAAAARKIAPGIYLADYAPYDSQIDLESEFTLSADGSFRLIWMTENEAFGDLKGAWYQKDSNLHFTGTTETYVDWGAGLFPPARPVDDDTNAVSQITDTSFLRKEWTPLRQKPYWIAYRKRTFTPVKTGSYQFSREIELDSATNYSMVVKIDLQEDSILFRYTENGAETDQYKAAWFQQGSILGAEGFASRVYDTLTREFSPWEPFEGVQMLRISEVTDTAFRIWAPPDPFRIGTWDVYRKVP